MEWLFFNLEKLLKIEDMEDKDKTSTICTEAGASVQVRIPLLLLHSLQ